MPWNQISVLWSRDVEGLGQGCRGGEGGDDASITYSFSPPPWKLQSVDYSNRWRAFCFDFAFFNVRRTERVIDLQIYPRNYRDLLGSVFFFFLLITLISLTPQRVIKLYQEWNVEKNKATRGNVTLHYLRHAPHVIAGFHQIQSRMNTYPDTICC